jgi:hypothetical protein
MKMPVPIPGNRCCPQYPDQTRPEPTRTVPLHMEVITRKEALERRLPTYWTGKRCHAGHLAKRYVDNYGCATCMAASHKRWRNSLGGEWNERAARYPRDNPEKWRETYRRSQRALQWQILAGSADSAARGRYLPLYADPPSARGTVFRPSPYRCF